MCVVEDADTGGLKERGVAIKVYRIIQFPRLILPEPNSAHVIIPKPEQTTANIFWTIVVSVNSLLIVCTIFGFILDKDKCFKYGDPALPSSPS
jgi:hypothetical protein